MAVSFDSLFWLAIGRHFSQHAPLTQQFNPRIAKAVPIVAAWFNFSIFAGDKSWVAGVELATASEPQRGSLGSGGVALGRRPQLPRGVTCY